MKFCVGKKRDPFFLSLSTLRITLILENFDPRKDIIDLLRCIRRCAKRLNADSHTCVIVNFRIQKQFFLFDLRIAFDQGFVLFTKQSPRRIATQIFAIRVEFHFIEYEYFLILFLHIQIIMINYLIELISIQYNSKLIDCTLKWSLMQL